MYPLRFQPIFRHYLWGGHRLANLLHKPVGEQTCAESWELVDHGEDQSVVAFGEFAGMKLGELVQQKGNELLGIKGAERTRRESLPHRRIDMPVDPQQRTGELRQDRQGSA